MGRNGNSGHNKGGTRKNKARMNYLKQTRQGGGGQGRRGRGGGRGGSSSNNQGTVDSAGYKTGDYVSSYGYFNKNKKRGPRKALEPGMKGFLCTTNFRESDCVREAYNLLNEYDDKREDKKEDASDPEKMEADDEAAAVDVRTGEVSQERAKTEGEDDNNGETGGKKELMDTEDGGGGTKDIAMKDTKPKIEDDGHDDDDSDLDIDEAIKKEMKELKSERVTRRFQCVDTGVKNVVFIDSTVTDPIDITTRIFQDVLSKREAKSRHILRFLPIEATCRTEIPTIRKLCKDLFEKHLKEGYNSFKVLANIRHNGKLSKDTLVANLAEVVSEVNPLNVVSLKEPTYTIVVEVLKTVFCVSVLKNFNENKKYNITEAASPDQEQPKSVTAVETNTILKEDAAEMDKQSNPEKTEIETPISAVDTTSDSDQPLQKD